MIEDLADIFFGLVVSVTSCIMIIYYSMMLVHIKRGNGNRWLMWLTIMLLLSQVFLAIYGLTWLLY